VVVVTASPDLYAAALADHLGLNDILCTRTELIDEQFTGRLAGPMMTGEQAARPGLPTVAWTPTVAA
jgi:phosphoserine phosphatase